MKKILLLISFISIVFANGCWDTQDDAYMAERELDDVMVFSFRDAVTCEAISDANVTFLNHNFVTNSNGEIEVPTPPDNIDIAVPLKLQKEGYITLHQKVLATVGSYWNTKFLVSKEIPIKDLRIVLAWSDKPRDLDLHLVGDDFHLSYRKKLNVENRAVLDRDATRGFGPETITVKNLDEDEIYKVYVYNYSAEAPFSGKANVTFYKNNKTDKVVRISSKHRCIQVATIHKNTITYTLKAVDNSKCK